VRDSSLERVVRWGATAGRRDKHVRRARVAIAPAATASRDLPPKRLSRVRSWLNASTLPVGQSCGVSLRVAILAPVPVPYREPLFATLATRGRIEPHVIYLSGAQPGWDQRPEWFAGRVGYSSDVLSSWQRGRPGRTPIMLARGLGGALGRAAPDCVVSWEYGPATWRALAWCRRHGWPLVIFSELTPWSDPELSPVRRWVHRLIAPRAAGFVVASSQGVARLERLGVDRQRVEVALQSADLEPLLALDRPERPAGSVRVLTIGRLVPDKNLQALIVAFAEAGFAEGEAELVVCGSGPLEDELLALAERLGVPARFNGYAAPADLPATYARADVLALVSTYEPFGVTMREGAAAGLPLLCSRRAGAAGDFAVEGENALLVDPARREEIVAALRRLVRDTELRKRLAAGSRAVTARHPPEADAEAWERAVLRATGAQA
jgi:glycosyltransferase involved in cell wall biosynthesis